MISNKLKRPFDFGIRGRLLYSPYSKHYDEVKVFYDTLDMYSFVSRSRRRRASCVPLPSLFIIGSLRKRMNMKTYTYQCGYKFEIYLDWKVLINRSFKVFHVNEYPNNFYRYRGLNDSKRKQLILDDEILDGMSDEDFLCSL